MRWQNAYPFRLFFNVKMMLNKNKDRSCFDIPLDRKAGKVSDVRISPKRKTFLTPQRFTGKQTKPK
ncbi:hypothetical protein BO224_10040 [Erysipelotrichaceae bacterium NYU-BL-E8]|uniref:Uncharacterized protein n=1 Tax=Ileibacterium valens TaxID=1862668 RepID=A0A1U7NI38_9FIRM|nr:hypothetical protein BO224_10040 [Erysipelotrichaceae bacterium NYU-BL-E8]OLU37999.1 hypothetical protein BM735_09885 [Erysipelotrichaceae bacterium NYU-BL-F16]OLU41833.1 hypothetical protein BO222_02575 [Ileibacterium valens]